MSWVGRIGRGSRQEVKRFCLSLEQGLARDGWGAAGLYHIPCLSLQWAGVLSRLALEQERILNPLLDRVRTADHNQLRSLTGLIRNLSRNARNKDEMCELFCPWSGTQPMPPKELASG